ncbi:oligopeptide/dipeptide ABC transporter ATP-binding protein [Actinomadura napierensis]|uniref:oligopeptide/dipeptide ABC transporter ATP-binding protein n=1 Tax=Actinomadura napierensis TaxID=267854 RepID=UPI0031CDB848
MARIADRIAVMYAGGIVEEGPARQVLSGPKHPYTRGLIRSIPDHLKHGALAAMPGVGDRPSGCAFAPRCRLGVAACTTANPEPVALDDRGHRVRCIRTSDVGPLQSVEEGSRTAPGRTRSEGIILDIRNLRAEHRSCSEVVVAAEDVSLQIRRGECVALVGESGSGKTTIARTIAGLHPIGGGNVVLGERQLPADVRRRTREDRRRIQIVFQNPADALNPRQTIGSAIGRPARLLRGLGKKEPADEVARLLDLVRLPQHTAQRQPGQLSGGEKQRVGFVRLVDLTTSSPSACRWRASAAP